MNVIDDWGRRYKPSSTKVAPAYKGWVIHHTAGPEPEPHTRCADTVRAIQEHHLSQNYRAIAYNFILCPHGAIYEGRGWDDQSGANGTHRANVDYLAVCLLGSNPKADKPRTEAFVWLYQQKPGPVLPHSAIVPTACPGDNWRTFIENKEYEMALTADEEAFIKNLYKKAAELKVGAFDVARAAADLDKHVAKHPTYSVKVEITEPGGAG